MKFYLFGSLLFLSCLAQAGTAISTIKYVQVNPAANTFSIKLDNPVDVEDRASCASDNRLTYRLDVDGGKAAFSVAVAAKASGKEIDISGSGDCTGSLENIGYIRQL